MCKTGPPPTPTETEIEDATDDVLEDTTDADADRIDRPGRPTPTETELSLERTDVENSTDRS